MTAANPESALLALTICDPACGSGHFLVAAARRIAARVARVRADGDEPTLVESQAAMHDVVRMCIYGVDLNPMATELAKVSLWLEALQPGRPLSFLDAHIKVGNALLGTTPALLTHGIPDEAYVALDGDDQQVVLSLKRQNKTERSGQGNLLGALGMPIANRGIADAARAIDATAELSLADVHLARRRQHHLERSPELRRARWTADAWCAAFVSQKTNDRRALTFATLDRWNSLNLDEISKDPVWAEVEYLTARHRFFHWHIEYPQVFDVPEHGTSASPNGWLGGFSCVLGNPPWERIKLQEQEFFAAKDPVIAGAQNAAARQALIKHLSDEQPALLAEFNQARRQADGESHFIRNSGRYPLCGRGHINTYSVFAETNRALIAGGGRVGMIVPTGIATDATTQHFFRDLVERQSLVSLYDFENRKPLFEGVYYRFRFSLLTMTGSGNAVQAIRFAFFLEDPLDLMREGVQFELSRDEISLLNPNTGTCSVLRGRLDAEATIKLYRRFPILLPRPNGPNRWDISFMSMFHMANDSGLFNSCESLEQAGWTKDGNRFSLDGRRMLPLYQGIMTALYDHRAADIMRSKKAAKRQNQPVHLTREEKRDPERLPTPMYWVDSQHVESRLAGRWPAGWLLGFSDVTSAVNARTMLPVVLPRTGVGHSLSLILSGSKNVWVLAALMSSLVFDYAARSKVGGNHMTFYILEQLPVPAPSVFESSFDWDHSCTGAEWVGRRLLELSYTAVDLKPFAEELGDVGPPFQWLDDRRDVLRAELDAAFLLIYGLNRGEAEYISGRFEIANRQDLAKYGEEHGRRLILEAFDLLAAASEADGHFVSTLDPPPGDGPRHSAR